MCSIRSCSVARTLAEAESAAARVRPCACDQPAACWGLTAGAWCPDTWRDQDAWRWPRGLSFQSRVSPQPCPHLHCWRAGEPDASEGGHSPSDRWAGCRQACSHQGRGTGPLEAAGTEGGRRWNLRLLLCQVALVVCRAAMVKEATCSAGDDFEQQTVRGLAPPRRCPSRMTCLRVQGLVGRTEAYPSSPPAMACWACPLGLLSPPWTAPSSGGLGWRRCSRVPSVLGPGTSTRSTTAGRQGFEAAEGHLGVLGTTSTSPLPRTSSGRLISPCAPVIARRPGR